MAAITINDIGVVTKEVFVAHTTRTLLERNEVAAAVEESDDVGASAPTCTCRRIPKQCSSNGSASQGVDWSAISSFVAKTVAENVAPQTVYNMTDCKDCNVQHHHSGGAAVTEKKIMKRLNELEDNLSEQINKMIQKAPWQQSTTHEPMEPVDLNVSCKTSVEKLCASHKKMIPRDIAELYE
jgi:hypothetical protein